jgi:hypothetical protein
MKPLFSAFLDDTNQLENATGKLAEDIDSEPKRMIQ